MTAESNEPFDFEVESFLGDVTSTNGSESPLTDDYINSLINPTVEFEPIVTESPREPPLKDDDPFQGDTTPIGDGTCVVCGAPTFRPPGLTKAGHRKRVPKHCDLHTPHARIPQERPSFTGVESQLSRIQEELADDIRLLGTMAGPLLPVTGYYLIEHADPFTIALLKLAKNNTRVLRVLHRAAQVAPIYTVAETVAGTAYAVQVDTKKADPYSTVGKRLGVSRVYDVIYNVNDNSTNNSTVADFSGPPRYSVVP